MNRIRFGSADVKYLRPLDRQTMRRLYHLFVKLIIFTIFFIVFYNYISLKNANSDASRKIVERNTSEPLHVIHLWCIVVKVEEKEAVLLRKFRTFLKSLLHHSRHSILSLNILTDEKSKSFVDATIVNVTGQLDYTMNEVIFYNIENVSEKIKPITETMQRHFSSVPGTYYSDSLFYMSLALHKIAPENQNKVILLDIDLKFKTNVSQLYKLFSKFDEFTLFALAPELSPVYHHILYQWKQSHPGSIFGEPSYKGFAGLNSGVVLMNLEAIRLSEEYQECISKSFVEKITAKYSFKGHLGDQDFYTLLVLERPHLVRILPCTWNRQLCEWWRHHGYADTFDEFARCDGAVNIYHGNCNSRIPDN